MASGLMSTVTPHGSYWMIKRQRIITGTELLGLQGFGKKDVHHTNVKDKTFNGNRRAQLAGEMFSLYTLVIYISGLMTTLDL